MGACQPFVGSFRGGATTNASRRSRPATAHGSIRDLESRSAKLLTLFLFGNVSIDARGHLLEEVDELREDLERWAKIVGISYGEVDYSQLEQVQESGAGH